MPVAATPAEPVPTEIPSPLAGVEPPSQQRRPVRYSAEDRQRVLASVWLLPGESWRLRFAVMLALSVVIGTTGLLADSPAVVIGAMLIAPLMTPVLAFSIATSMGWARHMARTATTVVAASAGSIALAWLLASVLPVNGDAATHEVVSRTAPTLLDLVVALAAGAAGAYATLRRDASAALPGVAVAVALVPPLGTVGVALQSGQTALAKGALLLYLANLVAIVLASIAVLLGSGFVPLPRLSMVKRRVAASTLGVTAATLAVAVLLSSGVQATIDEATTVKAVSDRVVRWLGDDSGLEVRHLSVHGAAVTVELAGSKPPPPTSALAADLVPALGPEASVVVRWSQRTTQTAPAAPARATTTSAVLGPDALRSLAEAWLKAAPSASAGSAILSIRVTGDELVVEVAGPVAPPQARPLATAVAAQRGRATKVTVRWTPRQEFAAASEGASPGSDASLRARQVVDSWARSHPSVAVLAVSVRDGVATVDLAAESTPVDLDILVAALRSQAQASAVVRLAPLQRVVPSAPTPP